MVPNFPLGKMVQGCRPIYPLPLMTIPDICFPPGFTIIRKNPSLRTPSIRPFPDMAPLMPATLIMEVSTSQNRSGSHLPDWESMSCMPNHVQGKARARLKSSIKWWMTSSVNQSSKISGHWKNYHYRVSGSIYLSVFLGSNANNLTKAFNKIFWFCVSNF